MQERSMLLHRKRTFPKRIGLLRTQPKRRFGFFFVSSANEKQQIDGSVVGDIMKGADGQMWEVKKLSSGSCQRWVRVRVVLSRSSGPGQRTRGGKKHKSCSTHETKRTTKSIPACALDGSNKIKRRLSEKCLVKTLIRTAYNRTPCTGCSTSGCYYTGKEASPKGFGVCAHQLSVGEKREGRDGHEWEVIRCGNGKRWKQLRSFSSSDSSSSDSDSD